MQCLELSRISRGLVIATRPNRKLTGSDRLDLWLSKGRKIDGLWVGTTESKPHPALRRVETALELIKSHDALHYSRIGRNLDRIWVKLIPSAEAHYESSSNACVIDERYALQETMTLERIASIIVHEATHARLEVWGILYHETKRGRIEAICLRRELNFLTKLPDSELMQEQVVRTLEWIATDHHHLSSTSFQEREDRGQVETLRYLNMPNWFVRFVVWLIRRRRQRASALRRP